MIAKFNSHTHVTNKLEMLLREIALERASICVAPVMYVSVQKILDFPFVKYALDWRQILGPSKECPKLLVMILGFENCA